MGYTISFFINGYGQQPESLSNVSNLPELPQLEEEGFTFDGWFLDEDLTVPAEVGMELTSDITLYAAWSRSRAGWGAGVDNEATTYAFSNDLYFDSYGGSSGNSSTTTTAKYINKDNLIVPNAWVTRNYVEGNSGDTVATLYTKRTYSNFLDSSGNAIQAYVTPTSDSWMSGNISGDFSDNGTAFGGCIIKGRMPLFSCPGFTVSANKTTLLSASSTNGTSTAKWLPFFSISTSTTASFYRTDDAVTITLNYSTPMTYTFDASDFRDGVVPEVFYFILQGAGGGGGGTTASSNGGGGGAGAIMGVLVNTRYSYELELGVGKGGTGGYKTEVASEQGKGLAGGRTYLFYDVDVDNLPEEAQDYGDEVYWYDGQAIAYGGGAGRDAGRSSATTCGGAGGSTYYNLPFYEDSTSYADLEEFVTDSSFLTYHSSVGGAGGNETKTGGGAPVVTFRTTKTACTTRTSGTYHNNIIPKVNIGGTSGDSRSGGGAASHFSAGGNGGITSSTQSNNYGKAGGIGAGGGGARYYLGRYNKGGNGGDGCILIFY